MSGDVQPRKRKDKKKKRDDEASHGVHLTKLGTDDAILHVHEDHGTGGHWCAKVIFFSLMTILLGLVCLIILENRGLSDMDTPLSESRFSNYFDGWVDEHRADHDDHHGDVHGSLEDHDDDHDEPFEEEADVSEGDEADEADEDENVTQEEAEEAEDHDDEDDDDEENVTAENDNATAEDDDDDNVTAENDGDAEEDEDDNVTAEDEENVTAEEEEDDNVTVEATTENIDEDDEEEDEDDEADNNTNEDNIDDNVTREQSKPASKGNDDDDDDDVFDEDEDDNTFDSIEQIVDNDASELELLKEKARQQAAAEAKNNPVSAENDNEGQDESEQAPSWASSLTVKIGVGLALALVARLVLLKNNPVTNEPSPEVLMKRRLTIASPEDAIPEDANEMDELLPENDFSEEEIEIEEEIEYIDEIKEEDEDPVEENHVDSGDNLYKPETFEQLNAMYRTKGYEDIESNDDNRTQTKTEPETYRSPYQTNNTTPQIFRDEPISNTLTQQTTSYKAPAVFEAPPPPPLIEARIDVSQYSPSHAGAIAKSSPPRTTKYSPPKVDFDAYSPQRSNIEEPQKEEPKPTKREVTYDADYQPEDDDIDYDEDDIYDDEEGHDDDSEELDDDELLDDDDDMEGEEEEISDVDDAELMSRLEAKYGKLPAKEFESDEDPEDPTWTQIKPKTSGGPQSYEDDDDDQFEQQLRRANAEMMREHFTTALQSFNKLIQKYPTKPEVYLGKARILDHYAEQQKSNTFLKESIELYTKYLDFNCTTIINNADYRAAAARCLDRIRFLGKFQLALPIHQKLIDRFPNEPAFRNELAITYLMLNRLSDAKEVLKETLRKWPKDGLALVHYGFVLKQLDHDYHKSAEYLLKGIDSNAKGTQDGRFYFQLGESYQRIGKQKQAVEIYKRGAELKLFPSVYQRSLYNEPKLQAQPYWSLEATSYEKFLHKLEQNWMAIKAEGLNALSKEGYFVNESENLKNKGDWKQFELYARGQQNKQNCLKAPITCSLIQEFPAARDCRRGQVKFSVMHAGTHVWPHCGPTNCRLRAHLGLVVPPGTRIRVAEEERSWQEGKFLIFDDSFEHEVWHEGHSLRLVLIVDVWHPDLTMQQRRNLSPI